MITGKTVSTSAQSSKRKEEEEKAQAAAEVNKKQQLSLFGKLIKLLFLVLKFNYNSEVMLTLFQQSGRALVKSTQQLGQQCAKSFVQPATTTTAATSHRFASTEAAQPAKNSENSSKYRFTLDSVDGVLTTEQRDFYEENGYIIVKNMVTSAELGRWHDRFTEYATGKRKPESPELLLQKELAVAKDSLNVNTLYKIGELYADEVLFEYCRHPKVLDHVQQFTGPNVMAIHTMLINKPPDTGSKSSRHPLHQDLHYFPNRPADRIVCAWTAMERITRENGTIKWYLKL